MPDDPQVDALKLPPHSIEAEQSVLGGLLLDNEAADRIGDVIGPERFLQRRAPAHLRGTSIRLDRAMASRPTSSPCPRRSTRRRSSTTSAGSRYLGALVQNVPTAANIRHYAQIVRERSILRQLAATAGEIADAAYNPLGRSAREVLDEAEAKVLHIAEQGSRGQQHVRRDREAAGRRSSSGSRRCTTATIRRTSPACATGFADLDRMTAGLQPGDLVIVAGQTEHGQDGAGAQHRRARRARC